MTDGIFLSNTRRNKSEIHRRGRKNEADGGSEQQEVTRDQVDLICGTGGSCD